MKIEKHCIQIYKVHNQNKQTQQYLGLSDLFFAKFFKWFKHTANGTLHLNVAYVIKF